MQHVSIRLRQQQQIEQDLERNLRVVYVYVYRRTSACVSALAARNGMSVEGIEVLASSTLPFDKFVRRKHLFLRP